MEVRTVWKSRSLLEKCLIILVATLVVIVFLMGTLLMVSRNRESQNQDEEFCLEEECLKTSLEILSSIDKTVDPCDDFYEYACGSWSKANPIPNGLSMWSTFQKLDLENLLIVNNALQKPITEMKSKAEKKAKLYYLTCMDHNKTIEALGAEPMLKLLDDVGGWNISGRIFNISTWSLQSTLHILKIKYNMEGLFTWSVEVDDRNSSEYNIRVDQGGLTLPTSVLYFNVTQNENVLAAYLEYMTKVGVLLGGEYSSTKAQMEAVRDFETKLATITILEEDRRDGEKLYHKMPITQLQKIAPFISWIDFFLDGLKLVGKHITESENVVVYVPQYLVNLTSIIQGYTNTTEGKIILNNYLVWQMVHSLIPSLSKTFRDTSQGLSKALIGVEGEEKSWKNCVIDTNTNLGFAVGAMYVREHFQKDSKTKAEDMINSLKTAFKQNLKYLSWMDKETIELAKDKADAISNMIGFPDFVLDPEELDENYKDLEVSESSYFDNKIHANQYNLRQNLQNLGSPVNITRWNMAPQTVNAYYSPNTNQIVFPAGILRAPFYYEKDQLSLNFGAIGVFMGHELTHAFDDQGQKYDKFGNLHQWWNNKTLEKFTNQTKCMIEQYSNYEINGIHMNGKQTLGENIADNGGLKIAFRAYKDWIKTYDSKLTLPALNLTHGQLFFVSFAQPWCSAATNETISLLIAQDVHSIAKYRVIGSLSNSPEFAQEFNCPLKSRMNPVNKCEVW